MTPSEQPMQVVGDAQDVLELGRVPRARDLTHASFRQYAREAIGRRRGHLLFDRKEPLHDRVELRLADLEGTSAQVPVRCRMLATPAFQGLIGVGQGHEAGIDRGQGGGCGWRRGQGDHGSRSESYGTEDGPAAREGVGQRGEGRRRR